MLIVFFLAIPVITGAKEVRLQRGEVYRDHDLTVMCEAPTQEIFRQAMEVRECQYWDDYAKKCLFEKTIFTYGALKCVEACQQWDSFKGSCDYQNTCTFYPGQEAFVMSTCDDFEEYSRKCLKVREETIKK